MNAINCWSSCKS